MYGEIHETVFKWLTAPDVKDDQLLLIPRGHLKSHCIAVDTVRAITVEPDTSSIYVSANVELAKVQMYAIKQMFMSSRYRFLWPTMFTLEEAKRDKWSEWAINVDHPLRAERGTRDYSLVIRTVGASSAGLHCDRLVFDDVVVDANARTALGRRETAAGIASFVGIKNPGCITKAVGTRYHPLDIYGAWIESTIPIFNDEGEEIGEEPTWDVAEAVVEDAGDGTGTYLWPRVQSPSTGKWYGFDRKVLARKKVEYRDLNEAHQFYSQYYNNPNDSSMDRVAREFFRYYDPSRLTRAARTWTIGGKELAVYAGMDCAFTDESDGKKSDSSSLVVIGVDCDGNVYILAMRRYRTTDFQVHYDHIIELHDKWRFKHLLIETNSGGKLVKTEVERIMRQEGRSIKTMSRNMTKHDGTKKERHALVVEPRYRANMVYHAKGGLTPELEEEVRLSNPSHDDLIDGLYLAMEEARPPAQQRAQSSGSNNVIQSVSRFGGRRKLGRG